VNKNGQALVHQKKMKGEWIKIDKHLTIKAGLNETN
jgi:hypothetical protein